MTTCANCGTENEPGRKFCGECGTPLARPCPTCGTPNAPAAKFCGECGTSLDEVAPPALSAPVAERRRVTVLFADLVGFTNASEGRDAEETRELLSRYFEDSRRVIERYGGTVEKFIGDAVMAVWGAPSAHEDDAERAVRSALELVEAVAAMGEDVGTPELRARAGVLTGEAAVTLGATGQGMVAGDLVNTASRAQSAAEPGTVLVGDATRQASEAAIAYEDAGDHAVKGKTEPIHLWRALRVVANVGGEGRSAGLEAPFVGRDRELRLVKELFDGSAEEAKAHLVLVSGIAGVGKSRLSWEFEKYVDGLAQDVWWHRGRCLSYGDGVAYWALAEMVRGRAGIVENEQPDTALEELQATLAEYVVDDEERAWIEARLAHLLGLGQRASYEREDLFAAWRIFFEHLADRAPVVLVFEDLQWADEGLLDWIEQLLELSRGRPLIVHTHARPDLADRRAAFGSAGRSITQLVLEPLSATAMEELLDGLVPGLPDDLQAAILERAEGVPLYAVETVRMLMSRGDLERTNGAYRVTGDVASLAVPETLHALVASRLDHLLPEERKLVQDASVLGKTFVRSTLAALAGISDETLEPVLQGLVRKEILFLESDPRSPERGQYGFLQDLVRHVAYETLARRDRKARHLAAARDLEETWAGREQEIVEVIAAHYLTAYDLDPSAGDAGELRRTALDVLVRAAERAASLGANAEAAASFGRAARLTDDEVEGARLLARAGGATRSAGDPEKAFEQLDRAAGVLEAAGDTHNLAVTLNELSFIEFARGRPNEATARLERAHSILADLDPGEDFANVCAQLARWYYFTGELELARERNTVALDLAESYLFPDALSHALNTAGLLAEADGHPQLAAALVRKALEVGLENDLGPTAFRAYTNLAHLEFQAGNIEGSRELSRRGVELSRRNGDLQREWWQRGEIAQASFELGDWDEDIVGLEGEIQPGAFPLALPPALAKVARHRGDVDTARRAVELAAHLEGSAAAQDRNVWASTVHEALMAEGRTEEALQAAERQLEDDDLMADSIARDATPLRAVEAAVELGTIDRADRILATLEARRPGDFRPPVRAHALRWRARIADIEGGVEHAEALLRGAVAMYDAHGMVFWLAVARTELAELLVRQGRDDEAAELELGARATFERLRAAPWLTRVEAIATPSGVPA